MKFFASLALLVASASAAAVANTTNTLVANFVDFQTKPEWAQPMEDFFKGFIPGVHNETGTLQYIGALRSHDSFPTLSCYVVCSSPFLSVLLHCPVLFAAISCTNSQYFHSTVTRSDVDRTRFKIFELYANMAAHDSHMSGSYQKVVQYIQTNDPLAAAPTTEKQFPIMKW
jgi:quinol monooxygenase YgiN